jgi:hypothetical protein
MDRVLWGIGAIDVILFAVIAFASRSLFATSIGLFGVHLEVSRPVFALILWLTLCVPVSIGIYFCRRLF